MTPMNAPRRGTIACCRCCCVNWHQLDFCMSKALTWRTVNTCDFIIYQSRLQVITSCSWRFGQIILTKALVVSHHRQLSHSWTFRFCSRLSPQRLFTIHRKTTSKEIQLIVMISPWLWCLFNLSVWESSNAFRENGEVFTAMMRRRKKKKGKMGKETFSS